VCVEDVCQPCGGDGEACCGASCNAPYRCDFRTGPDLCVAP
jgi:hypothetical protein